jgi:hypothetical protein
MESVKRKQQQQKALHLRKVARRSRALDEKKRSNRQRKAANRSEGLKHDTSPVELKGKVNRSSAVLKDHEGNQKDDKTFKSEKEALAVVTRVMPRVAKLIKVSTIKAVVGWRKRLTRSFVRLERGNYDEHRSPFFHNLSYAQIHKMITGWVASAQERIKDDFHRVSSFIDDFRDVEESQAEKLGPRGSFPNASSGWVNDQSEAIWSDKPPQPTLNRAALDRAEERLLNAVPAGVIDVGPDGWKAGLQPDKKSNSPLDGSTNSGFPSWVRGWFHSIWTDKVSVFQKLVEFYTTEWCKSWWARMMEATDYRQGIIHFVATTFIRTNVSNGYKPKPDGSNVYRGHLMSKLRVVNALDKRNTVLGKDIVNKLIDVCINYLIAKDGTRIFTALTTPERIDKNCQNILETCDRLGIPPLSTDFSHYDQSMPPWLEWEVCQVVAKWMTPRAARIWLAITNSEIFHTTCITPTKILGEGPISMASGRIDTNIVDSLVNLVTQWYGEEAGYYQEVVTQIVQGDDAVMGGPGVTPEAFEKCTAELGFEGNKTKQYYRYGSLSFCQKIHVLHYPGGIYPVARALQAITSTEDDVNMNEFEDGEYKYVVTYRTLCRANNCAFNPLFRTLMLSLIAEDRELHMGKGLDPNQISALAGDYASHFENEWKLNKPWVSPGSKVGFAQMSANRVVRGEVPPPPGKDLFFWVYGTKYEDVAL